MLLHLNSYW